MEPRTHLAIDHALCGVPEVLGPGHARARLRATPAMAVDARGLVHGGFVFGLADHAAMLAVNDPLVVLGAAETRFVAPVQVGDEVVAEARVTAEQGRRRVVTVEARVGDAVVMTGTFTTFVLDRHVLG